MHNLRYRDLTGFEKKKHNGLRITKAIFGTLAFVGVLGFLASIFAWFLSFGNFIDQGGTDMNILNAGLNYTISAFAGWIIIFSSVWASLGWVVVGKKVSHTAEHNMNVDINNQIVLTKKMVKEVISELPTKDSSIALELKAFIDKNR